MSAKARATANLLQGFQPGDRVRVAVEAAMAWADEQERRGGHTWTPGSYVNIFYSELVKFGEGRVLGAFTLSFHWPRPASSTYCVECCWSTGDRYWVFDVHLVLLDP